MSDSRSRRPAGAFIAVVAFLAGVIAASFGSDGGGTAVTGRASGIGATAGSDDVAATEDSLPAGGGEAGATTDSSLAGGSGSSAALGPPGAGRTSSGATTGTAGAGAAAAPAPAGGGAQVRSTAQGVTDSTIKIGVAFANAGALGPVAQIGDVKGHAAAAWKELEAKGVLPVHGRKVELVFREFDILSADQQRSVCVGFAQDDKVFAVVASLVFAVGAECLAREFKVPVIASAGAIPDDDFFRRTHPWLFYTNMSDTLVARNWVHWANDLGLLKGRKIGLYYPDDSSSQERVKRYLKPELRALGFSVAEDYPGGENSEALAVQRFKLAGVDLVLLMNNPDTFTQQANAQGYKPKYIVSEFLSTGMTADGLSTLYHQEQFDGTLAMSYYRRAENGLNGNPPTVPAGNECEAAYEKHSGRQISREQNSNEWDALQHACDQAKAYGTALQAAGPGLSQLGLVRALETSVRNQPSGEMADITFSPTKHSGASLIKTLVWRRDCRCWRHQSGFRALFVGGQ